MNTDNSKPSKAAEQYVEQTVKKLQKSVRNTLIVAIAILAAESIYFSVLNSKIAEGLTAIPDIVETYRGDFDKVTEMANQIPDVNSYSKEIEQVESILDDINSATGDSSKISALISSKIVHELNTQENIIANHASNLLNENLDNLPEWALKQIPLYSGRLQDKTELWINQFCVSTSDELGSTFDTFLDDHSEAIQSFSEATDDEVALQQLDEELTEAVATFMATTPIDNYGSLEEQSNQFLKRLKAANSLLRPLAENKKEDLTPEQQILRRSLGIFMNKLQYADLEKNN
jgi:hypothetical protein